MSEATEATEAAKKPRLRRQKSQLKYTGKGAALGLLGENFIWPMTQAAPCCGHVPKMGQIEDACDCRCHEAAKFIGRFVN